MDKEKSRLLPSLEAIKIIVQVVAIFVVGLWTYVKFIQTEAPFFKVTARVDRSASKPVIQTDGCLRSFSVTLINTGRVSFDVKSVVTQVWKFRFRRPDDEFVALVDLDTIEKDKPAFTKTFPDPVFGKEPRWYPFLQTYRPGEAYSHEFQMLFANEPETWFFMKTKIIINDDTPPKVAGFWGNVCRDGQPEGRGRT